MVEEFDSSQGKSVGELGREAMWFATHTLLAVLLLGLVVVAIGLTKPDPDSSNPKILCTVLALLVPMIGGAVLARVLRNPIAKYIWISGLLFFSLVCVWVLDLPTGNGLCEKCGAVEKLTRTFFAISDGSGLMAGDGVFVGTWIPLSMIGYAIGATLGLTE